MHKTEMITLLQDNKLMDFETAGAEIISNNAKKAGHIVRRSNQSLEVMTK